MNIKQILNEAKDSFHEFEKYRIRDKRLKGKGKYFEFPNSVVTVNKLGKNNYVIFVSLKNRQRKETIKHTGKTFREVLEILHSLVFTSRRNIEKNAGERKKAPH